MGGPLPSPGLVHSASVHIRVHAVQGLSGEEHMIKSDADLAHLLSPGCAQKDCSGPSAQKQGNSCEGKAVLATSACTCSLQLAVLGEQHTCKYT
jgi:hypothetical protein